MPSWSIIILLVIQGWIMGWRQAKETATLTKQLDLLQSLLVSGTLSNNQPTTTTVEEVGLRKIPVSEGAELLRLPAGSQLVVLGREQHRDWFNAGLFEGNKLVTGWVRVTEVQNIQQDGNLLSANDIPITQYRWNSHTEMLHLHAYLKKQDDVGQTSFRKYYQLLMILLGTVALSAFVAGLFMFLIEPFPWGIALIGIVLATLALMFFVDNKAKPPLKKQLDQVYRLATRRRLGLDKSISQNRSNSDISGTIEGLPEDIAALLPDFKINAIQAYGAQAGVSLKEAKRVIDEYEANLKRREGATESK